MTIAPPRRFRLGVPLLVGAAVLLTGCGSDPIDAATAGDFQAEVRTIASSAAAGDSGAAIVLAQRLKGEVERAATAGTVTEERAALIGARIDAVIASLEAGQVPADVVPSDVMPSDVVPSEEAPVPVEESVEPAPLPAPAETSSAPVEPAPAPIDQDSADDGESGDDAAPEDTGDTTPEDVGGEGSTPGGSGDKAAEKAAEQQRKAEEKAREAAEKAAEDARDKGKGNGGG
jgi:hypothetical protein